MSTCYLVRFCDSATSGGYKKFFSHPPQTFEIQAQFYKVKPTELNIFFNPYLENVNIVNVIFQLFFILLQRPLASTGGRIEVLLGKWCQKEINCLKFFKLRPQFKSPSSLTLLLVTAVITTWKSFFLQTAFQGSTARKAISNAQEFTGMALPVPYNDRFRESERCCEKNSHVL